MGRTVALVALVVASLACLVALLLAFTPILDRRVLKDFETYDHTLCDAFHHGPGSCLRYCRNPPSEFDAALVADQLVADGFDDRRIAELVYEFYAMSDAYEARAHSKDELDERFEWAAHFGAANRVLVALKRPRLRRVLAPYYRRVTPPAGKTVAPMTPAEHELLDPQWDFRPELFRVDGVIELVKFMRITETKKKLAALAAFVTEKGELDERALPVELLEDAWGAQVKITAEDNQVQFSSLGADSTLGGTGEDADFISTATVERAPSGGTALEARPELAAASGAPPPASVTLPRGDLDQALEHLDTLANQARIVPSFENGKAVGFKVFGIRKDSLYQRVGLESGDVVTQINGLPLDSPDKALEVYSKLRDSRTVTLSLLRSGKPYQLRVELK